VDSKFNNGANNVFIYLHNHSNNAFVNLQMRRVCKMVVRYFANPL
jgi:dUTPase